MPEPTARLWLALLPLLLLAAAFVVTDRFFTHIEDEVWAISESARPVDEFVGEVLRGQGRHRRPPLADLVLSAWVRLTDADPRLVRLPSMLFFLLGLWVWSLVAGRLAGPRAQLLTLWLGALWPYGFHFGRLANWYSLAFLLTALTTLAYLHLLEKRTVGPRLLFLVSAAALLYTTYYGWAILALIGLDFYLRERRNPQRNWWAPFALFVILAVAFLPLGRHLLALLAASAGSEATVAERMAWFAAGVWALFVSESVSPWLWWLSLPAMAAAAVASLLLVWKSDAPLRRMFLGGWLLLAGLAVLAVDPPRRLLLLAGWMLVPAAVALVKRNGRWSRAALALALAVPAGIGWYGTVSRQHYAAPRFLEPWREAVELALGARSRGALIVANHPVFFYYLTDRLARQQSPRWPFTGILPHTVTDPRVFDPAQMLAAGDSDHRSVVFVRGTESAASAGQTEALLAKLESRCLPLAEHLWLPDPAHERKSRLLPAFRFPAWRIEVRSFACVPESDGSAPAP